MVPLPTVEQVLRALREQGAEEVSLTVYGPRGPTKIVCLQRVDGDEVLLSQPLPETRNMSWKEFDSLCRQLALNPRSVDLGIPRPPSWWENPDELTEN